MKTSTGLQDSSTTDESTLKNVEFDLDLAELIKQHENTDWIDILGINAAEIGDFIGRQQTAGQKTRAPGFESSNGHFGWRPPRNRPTTNQPTTRKNHD